MQPTCGRYEAPNVRRFIPEGRNDNVTMALGASVAASVDVIRERQVLLLQLCHIELTTIASIQK